MTWRPCERAKVRWCGRAIALLIASGLAWYLPMPSAQAVRSPAQAAPPAAANVQVGKDIYLRYSCYACHGYAGHGGAGPRLVPMRFSVSSFTSFVRRPPSMPPYTARVLSDAQLADVWAYIKTLPESPPASAIPLLKPE